MSCVIGSMNMQQQTQGQPPGPLGQQAPASAQQQPVQRFQPWHTDTGSGELGDRRIIVEQIMQLFHRKRKGSAPDWDLRMPDFVRRLEERLYREAKTKEEYMDLSTLEQRLQAVAQRMQMMNNRVGVPMRNVNMIPAARPASSSMIPTPGATTMIPTPGLTSTAAKTNLQCPVPPPQRTMQIPVSGTQAQWNGSFVNGGVAGSPFIGNAQHSLVGGSGMYFPQGAAARDCFHQQRATILNGESSMVPSSKMIPVPGLPPHMVQQLQSENGQATAAPPRRQVAGRQQNQTNHQKRPVEGDGGQLPKCQTSSSVTDTSGAFDPVKAEHHRKKSSFLILVLHSMRCPTGEGQCSVFPQCFKTRLLFRHARTCREERCQNYPACPTLRALLRHFTQCQAEDCPVCLPARRQGFVRSGTTVVTSTSVPASGQENHPPAAKRQRLEADVQVKAEAEAADTVAGKGKSQALTAEEPSGSKLVIQPKAELPPVKMEAQEGTIEVHSSSTEVVKRHPVRTSKQKASGISLMELFSAEQIRQHIHSLRLWIGQTKAKAEKNQSMEVSESACRLCQVERLTFEPPPLYCTTCGGRIKRNLSYYFGTLMETRHYFCIPCYNDVRGETVEIEGHSYPKGRLEKKKNDEETEEGWVQCDKCNVWLHQICTLFNSRRNEGGETEFVCPFCLMADLDKGGKPLPPNSVLGAKDLPRTLLSDHLEQRLFRKLQQERAERARLEGKLPEEVPGAEGLVIRVVSSVDKKLEVKPRFMEIFKDTEYPTDYNYKSKALLLFQNIEGVEVCLFSLYVQEFGSDCSQPNNRRLYIAYLDSVKYFRPEVKTVHGEALRTFVYHEILIGYLEYAKRRGFGSCYIWACPPLRGEDYILYCHPEIQKTPRNEKLREWYLAMLNKATKEDIVAELTNFYDYFFVSPEECKANVSAARLPYFDGDYWPGAAEEMLLQIQQEDEEKRKVQRRAPCKKGVAKRVGVGVQAEMASNSSRDLQLMHKLGVVIEPMKGDFIMVHMHYSCRHCRQFITSGCRWICKQCSDFYLCNRCYLADQKLDEKDRHPWNCREFHQFYSVEVAEIPADTTDKDDTMESEFFDTRQSFLSLCQGNHYQYDTLRRAKHSSMMILYHLHNPTEPAFVTTCNVCHHEIEPGQGWRCNTCPDFDVCAICYPKEQPRHPHQLTRQVSVAERNAQNKEARQQRVEQLRRMLELLTHASQCCAANCSDPKCRNVKNLFRHGTVCKTRASGGCRMCKTMWHVLQLHARACKESDCRVPRCKDLKEHIRRSQLQSESRRRAAVNEMVRQRAADFASATS